MKDYISIIHLYQRERERKKENAVHYDKIRHYKSYQKKVQ